MSDVQQIQLYLKSSFFLQNNNNILSYFTYLCLLLLSQMFHLLWNSIISINQKLIEIRESVKYNSASVKMFNNF